MIEKRYLLSGFGRTVINLGKAGEAGATCVLVDVSEWMDKYPNAAVKLFVTPPSPHEPYFADVTIENKVVRWELWEADTTVAGNGSLELLLMDGDRLIKSVTARTTMTSSPSQEKPAGDKPQASPTWWKEALRQIEDAKQAAISEIDGTFDSEVAEGEAALAAAGAAQQSAIENKGKNTLDSIPEDYTALANDVSSLKDTKAPVITEEASGAIVTVDDAAAMNVHGLVSTIKPVQAAGTPTPEVPLPISGWDSVKVNRTGKNLIPYPYVGKSGTYNGVTFTVNADGTVIANGTATTRTLFILVREAEKRFPVGMLRVTGAAAGTNIVDGYTGYFTAGAGGQTFNNNGKGRIDVSIRVEAGVKLDNVVIKPMITTDLNATYDSYEPYQQAQTLSAALPEPVYGGTLDWKTGVLTVPHIAITLTGDEDILTAGESKGYWYLYLPGVKSPVVSCSHYKKDSMEELGVAMPAAEALRFYVVSTYGGDIGAWRTYLREQYAAGKPVRTIVTRATPKTFQLTPQQLETLKGLNNVWSDCGDTSIVYCADTKMFFYKTISELVTLALAKQ